MGQIDPPMISGEKKQRLHSDVFAMGRMRPVKKHEGRN